MGKLSPANERKLTWITPAQWGSVKARAETLRLEGSQERREVFLMGAERGKKAEPQRLGWVKTRA